MFVRIAKMNASVSKIKSSRLRQRSFNGCVRVNESYPTSPDESRKERMLYSRRLTCSIEESECIRFGAPTF